MDLASARTFLAFCGYGIVERVSGWHECLLEQGDERWVGRGVGADSALHDAIRQAFPSELSRALLAEALSREASAAVDDQPTATAEATPSPQPVEAVTPSGVLPTNDVS